METIVKGKIQEVKYLFKNEIKYYNPYETMLKHWYWSTLDYLNDALKEKEKFENCSEDEYIIKETPITIDYETFYKDYDLEFTLNVGDLIFIKDMSYKIEKVEGTDNNEIIYYVDNVLTVEEDFISYETAREKFYEFKYEKLENIKSRIDELENEIQLEKKLKEEKEKEKEALKQKEIAEFYEKQYRQKWYQFWKRKKPTKLKISI